MDARSANPIQNPKPLPEDSILAEPDSICNSCSDLRSTSASMEETSDLESRVSELLQERKSLDSVWSVKEVLVRINQLVADSNLEERNSIGEMGLDLEMRVLEWEERWKREKKELQNSIVSLSEENRDVSSLLRIALVEKEAVERSLSRTKGSGEQKRTAILQIAERGLQRVGFGFGFMMGLAVDQPSTSSWSTKSDGSDSDEVEEEEVISLAANFEKIMRNLRLEINDLKRALDDSRSDNERLQMLVDKQAEKLTEKALYITNLEEREKMLALNVEELMEEIAEAGQEVARWREACELEVEAGKVAIEEREEEVAMIQQELERTKAAFDSADSKLSLKEKLAATAMAAQAAAEASLQLADIRAAELRDRIEELTRQVEEEAERGRNEQSKSTRKRVRHVCWPWRALKLTPNWQGTSSGHGGSGGASWVRNRSIKMLPGMEALLHNM